MRAANIDTFIGKYVSVKFDRDYIDNHRDPNDPDSWSCEGYLAKNGRNNKYLLVFHPDQYEARSLGMNYITEPMTEEDIESITLFNLIGNPSWVSSIPSSVQQFLQSYAWSFGNATSVSKSMPSSRGPRPPFTGVPCCNNCCNSDLLNMRCKATGSGLDENNLKVERKCGSFEG